MSNTAHSTVVNSEKNAKFSSNFSTLAIPACIVAGLLIFFFVMGNSANFEGGDTNNHPVKDGIGHVLGLIYKGGYIVPILLSLVLVNITFSLERFITIARANGKLSAQDFVIKIRNLLGQDKVDQAIQACDEQKGSLANVVHATLHTYQKMEVDRSATSEQKILAVQKEVEEATSLELPMLEKNLVIIATLASGSTLVALLGTVLGMIKAFAALGASGGGDQMALSIGISEALINTALGIGNAALATFLYSYFTTKIDTITYAIDEAGYSIVQTFTARNAK